MRAQTSNGLMFNLFRLLLISMLLAGMLGQPRGRVHAAGTIYVKWNASGTNTGTSWENAYTNLQTALSSAVSGDEIWVAAGTYYPYPSPDTGVDTARYATFTLKNGVNIYGGFDGTENELSERDPAANVTILSGDLNGDDVGFTNNEENSYHVVSGGGAGNTAILDGFTITQGHADHIVFGSDEQYAGGVYNLGSSPTLRNLVITGNKARYGAGMLNKSNSDPIISNVVFSNNVAERGSGMFNTLGSDPTITNVTFSGNSASGRGGGMHNAEFSVPILTNVTFSGNSALWGGGLSNTDAAPELFNVTFSGNTAGLNGGAIHNEGSSPELTNVTISSNSASTNGGGIYNENSNPVITNSIIYGNSGTQIYNLTSSPVVSYSIVQGGYTGTGNLSGDPKLLPLADNGGFTQTMALDTGSAAIDQVDSCPLTTTDQRGVARPQGTKCDLGAFEVDVTPPDTTIDSFPSNPDNDSTPTFTFSGDDGAGSGIASFMCKMDSGSYSACSSPFTSSTLSAGSHTFSVYAIDNDGNADSSPAIYTWSVEYTTTVSSIIRANASPTSVASVNFTVSFSEDVSNVDTGDFILSTTGVSGASITSVSGSGDTYTVSVSTGTGNGTVRLDVIGNASIVDMFGNPLANLPYTAGESYEIIKVSTFADTNGHWAWRWIETFYDRGITTGCLQSPLRYCPERQVTRAEMAVFILRAKHGSTYQPNPSQTGMFSDVPVENKEWMQPWIEQFYEEGITTGCLQSPLSFCPEQPVTRAEMAVFINRAFGIPPLP